MKAVGYGAALLVVTLGAQLAVPASMIIEQEQVLRSGAVFKFRTAPVDPYDAFRGKYVALAFEIPQFDVPDGEIPSRDSIYYAGLAIDSQGYARLSSVSTQAPSGPYLKVHGVYNASTQRVSVSLPFNRFYLEESLAPRAEAAYRRYNAAGPGQQLDCYVTVRIANGVGALQDLFLDGRPIHQVLSQER